jgi:glycosyltransferase involved in cell wall biosynthesis
LASAEGSLPEVLGDSVEYVVNEEDIKDIVWKLDKLVENYKDSSQKSLENVERYKWENTIEEIFRLVKEN